MAERVKSYIDLEMEKEVRKTHKESKKDTHEGKKTEQCHKKGGHQDDKRRSQVTCPNREVYETFTPPNQEISIILNVI